MMQATQPELYMNMQQFSELKLEARQHSADAGKKAAQQLQQELAADDLSATSRRKMLAASNMGAILAKTRNPHAANPLFTMALGIVCWAKQVSLFPVLPSVTWNFKF